MQRASWSCQVLIPFYQIPRFLVAWTCPHPHLSPPKSVLILSSYLVWLVWKCFFELHLRLLWSTSNILGNKKLQEYVHTKSCREAHTHQRVHFGLSSPTVQSLLELSWADLLISSPTLVSSSLGSIDLDFHRWFTACIQCISSLHFCTLSLVGWFSTALLPRLSFTNHLADDYVLSKCCHRLPASASGAFGAAALELQGLPLRVYTKTHLAWASLPCVFTIVFPLGERRNLAPLLCLSTQWLWK